MALQAVKYVVASVLILLVCCIGFVPAFGMVVLYVACLIGCGFIDSIRRFRFAGFLAPA